MKKTHTSWESIKSVGIALLIALAVRSFLIEPYKIPSSSMVPGLLIGDQIFANKFVYGLRIPFTKIRFWEGRDPNPGEVIIFLYPEDESKNYIKRVIGVPGDRVRVEMDTVFVNGVELPKERLNLQTGFAEGNQVGVTPPMPHEKMTLFEGWGDFQFFLEQNGHKKYWVQYDRANSYQREIVVPPGHYFVMGDNRDNSLDSRAWGFVPRENIKGRGMFVWLSLDWKDAPYGSSLPEALFFHIVNPPKGRWHRFGRWIY